MKPNEMPTANRKTYNTPRLTQYGSVAALTRQNANSPASDAGRNRMDPMRVS
jgi:hypothetical protein